jgi:hypothetical protein
MSESRQGKRLLVESDQQDETARLRRKESRRKSDLPCPQECRVGERRVNKPGFKGLLEVVIGA